MEDLMKILETKITLFIAYYPQTNRQTEWINQEVETFLQHYINYQQNDWMEWLLVAELQYNKKMYGNQTYSIWIKLWKISMEKRPDSEKKLLKLKNFLKRL